MSAFVEFFSDYTIRNVFIGSSIVGVVSGSLGSFAVLRKQSLLGDAISHAALPGIALAFLLTKSKAPLILLLGAAVAGWLGTLAIMHITKHSRIKEDSALGLILSVFFGIGMVLLTFIQKIPTAAQAGLDKFLFGQAATLMSRDIRTMALLGGISFALMIGMWKEFKLLAFDPDFGEAQGISMRRVDIILTTSLVIAIVLGLQAVGVVLMSAMVVIPGISARQWADKLGGMVALSGCFGAFAGVTGALISSSARNLPTGPTIVISLSAILLISIFFGAKRGLVWRSIQFRKNRKHFALDRILEDLHTLAEKHDSFEHGHPLETLEVMRARIGGVRQGLRALADRGYVVMQKDGTWSITESGTRRVISAKESR